MKEFVKDENLNATIKAIIQNFKTIFLSISWFHTYLLKRNR
ncbi:hypothetical protein [Metamycoplasma neophronis]|nr:hypothetical protein [Metamycoplasma neophronis]